MSNYFNVSFRQFVELLTPSILRKPVLLALLQVLVLPATFVYNNFMRHRNNNLYRLSITGQVFSLEKMLNDRYDSTQRRIYIKNADFFDPTYIFYKDEDKDEYLFTEGETEDMYLYLDKEVGAADFIVFVPRAIFTTTSTENEMLSLINIYKQPGNIGVISRI